MMLNDIEDLTVIVCCHNANRILQYDTIYFTMHAIVSYYQATIQNMFKYTIHLKIHSPRKPNWTIQNTITKKTNDTGAHFLNGLRFGRSESLNLNPDTLAKWDSIRALPYEEKSTFLDGEIETCLYVIIIILTKNYRFI